MLSTLLRDTFSVPGGSLFVVILAATGADAYGCHRCHRPDACQITLWVGVLISLVTRNGIWSERLRFDRLWRWQPGCTASSASISVATYHDLNRPISCVNKWRVIQRINHTTYVCHLYSDVYLNVITMAGRKRIIFLFTQFTHYIGTLRFMYLHWKYRMCDVVRKKSSKYGGKVEKKNCQLVGYFPRATFSVLPRTSANFANYSLESEQNHLRRTIRSNLIYQAIHKSTRGWE